MFVWAKIRTWNLRSIYMGWFSPYEVGIGLTNLSKSGRRELAPLPASSAQVLHWKKLYLTGMPEPVGWGQGSHWPLPSVPSIFGRSVDPIPTRRVSFCPPFTTGSPKNLFTLCDVIMLENFGSHFCSLDMFKLVFFSFQGCYRGARRAMYSGATKGM